MRKYEGEPDYAAGEYDAISRRHWAYHTAVAWLIIITVAVYLLEVILAAASPRSFSAIFGPLALSPQDVFRHARVWQLLTYAFLDNPSNLLLVLFNVLFLFWFGREIEGVWGLKRFLAFYLSAAVFAGLAVVAVHFLIHEIRGCVSASGAIMALVMVYGLWWPDRTILFMFLVPMRMWTFVFIIIAVEAVSVLQVGGVASLALMGGGLVYGYLVARAAPRFTRRFERSWVSKEARKFSDERRMDELLDKVHAKGIGSLGWRERRFLKMMSRRR